MPTTRFDISLYKNIYFLGIGGIGMSSLARYFNQNGLNVGGYDKTSTPLTTILSEEGIKVHFEDLGENIPSEFQSKENTLVIYTPAIPAKLGEFIFLKDTGFTLKKRAEILGIITENSIGLGVAGTHGKTTTSTLLAHILDQSSKKCNAFLGGISTNANSNFISTIDAEFTVVEADEFDRSFLQLSPFASIVTTTDADHLDIYGDSNTFLEGFKQYAKKIDPAGFLVRHVDVDLSHPNTITYSFGKGGDYFGNNAVFRDGKYFIDIQTESSLWPKVEIGLPGEHNAENAVGCVALCQKLGLTENEIRLGLATFKGVKRRFEYHLKNQNSIYIDDYAHHPTEIGAFINAVKKLYPSTEITAIFQPHLFSRTRDFFNEFAEELGKVDTIILLPIYPAREEPIEGITSNALLDAIKSESKMVLQPEEAINYIKNKKPQLTITIGAGDIDKIVSEIKSVLS